MRINTSDKAIAYLTLLSGLAISGVAEYYSIMGLIAIYPAAFWPIVVMGVVLGFGKISGTVWLKQNWTYAPWFLKTYILPAIAVLMMITSLGVFGFLSKAHSDQSLVSGDVQSKIAVYDEKIKTAKENIDANRKALKQMDEAVDQSMARSNDEKGADKAVAIRRGQQKERQRLQSEIAAEQTRINQLTEERAPIAAEVRKVEAEVGPIKYIAHLLYGENPDANILEKAVIWVTVLIVIVLDPLAVILLLASQFSFQRFRQVEEEGDSPLEPVSVINDQPLTVTEPVGIVAQEVAEVIPEAVIVEEEPKAEVKFSDLAYLNSDKSFWAKPEGWVSVPPMVYVPEITDDSIIEDAVETEKAAMKAWKSDNPDSSLKQQRKLLEIGAIDVLPWENYLKPQADFADEAAMEAAKWAEEQRELKLQEAAAALDVERPGDYVTPPESSLSYMENVDGHQIKKTIDGYTQNAEQSESTLWNRVQQAKK